jgi:GAF domain-containing protein
VLPELSELLHLRTGTADERINGALAVLVEQLGMRTAIVSWFEDGQRFVTHQAGEPLPESALAPMPAEETLCHLVATGDVGPLVGDTAAHEVLGRHGHVEAYRIGAWVGVPITLGEDVVGTVCALAGEPRPDLSDRDTALLVTVGDYVSEVLAEVAGVPGPAQLDLPTVATSLAGSATLEGLTRPVLELVQELTGLESTFLTVIDWGGEQQQVRYSLNTGEMQIPEGLSTPWEATLCRRSLNEGRPYTRDVPLVWGDMEVARDLAIQTYVSVPLRDADDMVIGTLCGTSRDAVELDDRAVHSMRMLGQLLSAQIHRESTRAVTAERAEEREATAVAAGATRDPETGLMSRTGVRAWLRSVIPGLRPDVEQLALGWVDILPATGATAPPADWTVTYATVIRSAGRAGDLHGRIGDAFVVASVLPASEAGVGSWRDRLIHIATTEAGQHLRATVGVATTSDPNADPDLLLQRAATAARQDPQTP